MAEVNIYINGGYEFGYETDAPPRKGETVSLNIFDNKFERIKRRYNVVKVEHVFEEGFEMSCWIAIYLEEASE